MSETLTITASTMTSYRTSWTSGPNEIVQGYYNNGTSNIWWGHFWFSASDLQRLRSTLTSSMVVERVELFFQRDNTAHGATAAVAVKVYCTNLTSASGTPSTSRLSDGVVIGSLDRGEGKWCPMTVAQLKHLLNGGNGFCTYHEGVNTAAPDYSYYVRSTVKPQLRVTYSYAASTGQLSASSVDFGSHVELTITPYSLEYSHEVTWKLGGNALTQTIPAGTTSASYAIPFEWLTTIPAATSGTASVTLTTLQNGAQMGAPCIYSFTVTAPPTVVPTIGSVTATRVDNGVPPEWGLYVQGKSKANIAVNDAAGVYGSTITSYTIAGGGFSSSASTLASGILNNAGTVTFTATVRDSRGRTASKSVFITVYPYEAPGFGLVSAFRCDATGAPNNEGTYFNLVAEFSYAPVNGMNTVLCSARYHKGDSGVFSDATLLTSGAAVVLGGGGISVDSDYDVVLTLADGIHTATHIVNVPSAAYTMHFKAGGRGVAFGKASTIQNAIEVDPGWALFAGGRDLAALTPEMIGAMPVTGGAFTGTIELVPDGTSKAKAVVECGDGGASLQSYGDASDSKNRRLLQLSSAAAQANLDNAVLLTTYVNGTMTTYRLFHEGMITPIPVKNGGTGGVTPKAALTNLGIFYAATLPSSGTDGQICLVPVG